MTSGLEVLHTARIEDRYAGYRAMWLKVIIRAVFDWVQWRDSSKLVQLKYAESAQVWLFSESDLFNGFENICHNLIGVDPERIRRWARSLTKDQITKIEHLERGGDSDLPPLDLKSLSDDGDSDEYEDAEVA